MENYPLVHIVMLSFNNCQDTISAIESLSSMTYPRYKLTLVDNASTDETLVAVRERFPEVTLLPQPLNLGFAGGANVGIKHAFDSAADYVLLVNNDIVVSQSMLTNLVENMAPDVGAAAPLIYYSNDPERIWSAGFSKHPLLLEMRGGSRGQIDRQHWSDPLDVDYLLGCTLLISVPALMQTGLFDERFFFYYEDLDLSLRLKQHGYRLLTIPTARMWHKVAGSSSIGSLFRTYQMARSSTIFFRTHVRGIRRPLVIMYRLASALASSWRFLWGGRVDLLKKYWQGLWNGFRTS